MRSNETMRSREAALLTEKRALCGILEQCRSIKTRDAGRTCSKNDRRCAFRCDPSSQRGRNRCPADGQRGWHTCGLLARSLLSRALTFVSLDSSPFCARVRPCCCCWLCCRCSVVCSCAGSTASPGSTLAGVQNTRMLSPNCEIGH